MDFVDSPSLAFSRARIGPGIFRLLRTYTTWKLRRLERKVHRICDASIYISSIDAAAAKSNLCERIHVIPNGVSPPVTPVAGLPRPADRTTIGFLGDMSYSPNVSAALRLATCIFPRVSQAVPGARLLIIGRNPLPEIRRLQSDSVTVTGEVLDVWEFIARTTVFAFPLTEGAGLQNKILEAMYGKVPVVTTSLAARSLQAIHGKHLLIAESDGEITAQIVRLLSDSTYAMSLAENAADFIAQRFLWPSVLASYDAIIDPQVG